MPTETVVSQDTSGNDLFNKQVHSTTQVWTTVTALDDVTRTFLAV